MCFIVCVDKDNSDALSSGAVVATAKANKRFNYQLTAINVKFVFDDDFEPMPANNTYIHLLSIGTPVTVIKLSTAGKHMVIGDSGFDKVSLRVTNSNIELANADNYIRMYGGSFRWHGGTLVAGSGVTELIE